MSELEATDVRLEEARDILSHYGVKGMRWGIRKRRSEADSTPVDPQPVAIKRNNRSGQLQTSGGAGHKPSDDALTALAIRQKARASGSVSLSNKEMETLVKRLNLEANYAKAMAANAPPKGKGKQFLENAIKGEMDAAFKGKKGPFTNFVGIMIKGGRGAYAKNKAKKAAAAGASAVVTKVLTGKVVN